MNRRYTLTILEQHLAEARSLCFSVPDAEGACFLLCGVSQTETETRLLCREVLAVSDDAYLERWPDFLSLDSSCYVNAAKRARAEGLSIVFVHSHPGGYLAFSEQDDREEPKLQEFFSARVPTHNHGALVLTEDGIIGRIWREGFFPMDLIRVVGSRFRYHLQSDSVKVPDFYDRQVRAFGEDIQKVLSQLHIGVVGAGGTGSAVIEQLTRLGVGRISTFDEDRFESTNVNRLYGSGVADEGLFKVDIAARNVHRIGTGTNLAFYPAHITQVETAMELRNCDLVFGCTDKEAPRAILTQLATFYLIPLIDLGVLINSENGRIRDVIGRVTTAFPTEACLYCRDRINVNVVRFEMLSEEQQTRERADGYAPELLTRSPAVVTFTTAVAAGAVTELLHRLTGFMGTDRQSTEVLYLFDKSKIVKNRQAPNPDCQCTDRSLWGAGDTEHFLNMF